MLDRILFNSQGQVTLTGIAKLLLLLAAFLFAADVCFGATPDDEAAQAAVAVELAKLRLKVTQPEGDKYDPYGVSYEKLREHVLRGHRGFLTVGGTDRHVGTYQTHAHVPSGFHGIADGEYVCYLENGKAMMRPVASAQEVAPAKSKSEVNPGGCGCTASRNCGAAFCKSKGGTGCPQSCPVK